MPVDYVVDHILVSVCAFANTNELHVFIKFKAINTFI